MTWAGALNALETALNAAAATVNALDTTEDPFACHAGELASPIKRDLRYWYAGDQESSSGGNTLSKANVEEKITIRWYWPVKNRDDVESNELEVQLQAANRATQAQLLADAHLGEHAIALRIDDTSTAWQQVGQAWIRVLTIPIRIDLAEVSTITN